jgi:hypothetical protein
MRRGPLLWVALSLVVATLRPPSMSLARYTDTAASTGSIAADTLAPPTVLAAVGGASVTLTWVPSVDAYATGYSVYRSATSGSGYVFVSTVSPGSATTTSDSPGTGTWYYVVTTTFQSWSSVNSNQASATVSAPTSTAFVKCVGASNLADASGAGDNNGYQSNPSRACVNDSSFAVDSDSGSGGTQSCGTGATPDATKDRHRFWGFAFGLPGTVSSINGIRLQADLKLDAITGSHNLCAQLSWDAGTTWTAIKSVAMTAAAETSYTFGSTTDNWGHPWSLAQLNTTNFRIRLIDASSVTGRDFSLDYVALSVTYTP